MAPRCCMSSSVFTEISARCLPNPAASAAPPAATPRAAEATPEAAADAAPAAKPASRDLVPASVVSGFAGSPRKLLSACGANSVVPSSHSVSQQKSKESETTSNKDMNALATAEAKSAAVKATIKRFSMKIGDSGEAKALTVPDRSIVKPAATQAIASIPMYWKAAVIPATGITSAPPAANNLLAAPADVKKSVDRKTSWMMACLLTYRIISSKHQTQHMHVEAIARFAWLSGPWACLAMNVMRPATGRKMPEIPALNARLPRWYRIPT
mmetsp:Transcript_80643/g.233192  ORF Transcript_80643/g.233192 Transcript_80643/m.233192 type:complete len:269 (-) Transcript_80643:411-1217(-)